MASSIAALAASLRGVAERLRDLLETARRTPDVDAAGGSGLDDDKRRSRPRERRDPRHRPAPDAGAVAEDWSGSRTSSRARGAARRQQGRGAGPAVEPGYRRAPGGQSGRGGDLHRVAHHPGLSARAAARERPGRDERSRCFAGPTTRPGPRRRWHAGRRRSAARLRRTRPSRDVAIRLALVHEFRTRSRVFISTEAGAKGLNLQFCDTSSTTTCPGIRSASSSASAAAIATGRRTT